MIKGYEDKALKPDVDDKRKDFTRFLTRNCGDGKRISFFDKIKKLLSKDKKV